MKRLLLLITLVALVVGSLSIQLVASCGCDENCEEFCPDGYHWIGYGECHQNYPDRCWLLGGMCGPPYSDVDCQKGSHWSIYECDEYPNWECEENCSTFNICLY